MTQVTFEEIEVQIKTGQCVVFPSAGEYKCTVDLMLFLLNTFPYLSLDEDEAPTVLTLNSYMFYYARDNFAPYMELRKRYLQQKIGAHVVLAALRSNEECSLNSIDELVELALPPIDEFEEDLFIMDYSTGWHLLFDPTYPNEWPEALDIANAQSPFLYAIHFDENDPCELVSFFIYSPPRSLPSEVVKAFLSEGIDLHFRTKDGMSGILTR